MAFCAKLLTFSMFLSLIHVVACFGTSFVFMAEEYAIVWIYYIFHQFIDSRFQLLFLMNNVAMNIVYKFFWWEYVFNSLGYIPKSGHKS